MKISQLILVLAVICLACAYKMKEPDNCRFAKQFTTQDFVTDSQKVDDFLRKFIRWETNFIKKIGVDSVTGFTFDGIRIDVTTGEPLPEYLHRFTASSKECIHLAIMAKVLQEAQFSQEIYDFLEVFRILEKKVNTLQQFYKTYPGFAGYMPWVMLNGSKIDPTYDFKSRVPALDNGEMFWAALALSRVWQKKFPNVFPQLRTRFDEVFWKGMIRNVRKVFFNETTMKIRAVANIKDVKLPLDQNQYTNQDNYYLDDPYEGEMFIWIVTLLAKDQFSPAEIDYIWADKRNKLQAVNYTVQSKDSKKITVQRGYWFSSHEQWKLLFMPYFVSPIYKIIQKNNEKARTWHSIDKEMPGMYGCQAGPVQNNVDDTGYYCSGIEEIAFQKIKFDKLVTPYGVYPLLLINKEIGAAWLHNTIYSPCGQTKYGALEGTGLTGDLMSPILTWDTKITAALAVMNGTWAITMDYLQQKNLLQQFAVRVQNEYRLAFQDIAGEDLQLPLPRKQIATGRPDFTTCK